MNMGSIMMTLTSTHGIQRSSGSRTIFDDMARKAIEKDQKNERKKRDAASTKKKKRKHKGWYSKSANDFSEHKATQEQ